MKLKNWGWACESVVAIDVVTPNGQLVRADSNANEDLFWAARGGGSAFPGIVARFHLQTQSALRVMRSSVYVFPHTHYKTALNWALEVRIVSWRGLMLRTLLTAPDFLNSRKYHRADCHWELPRRHQRPLCYDYPAGL